VRQDLVAGDPDGLAGASAGEAEETLRGQLCALAGPHEPRESIAVALLTRSGIAEIERVTQVPAVEIRRRLLSMSI
jgi:hypothetical protein